MLLLAGRSYVTSGDIKTMVADVLRHRVVLSYEAEAEEVDANQIVSRILASVPVLLAPGASPCPPPSSDPSSSPSPAPSRRWSWACGSHGRGHGETRRHGRAARPRGHRPLARRRRAGRRSWSLAGALAEVRRIHIQTGHRVNEVMGGEYRSVFKGRGMEFEEVRSTSSAMTCGPSTGTSPPACSARS